MSLVIKGLPRSPNKKRKDEMNKFEYFECTICTKICEMPIEQYKGYTEDEILNASFICEPCDIFSRRGRPPGRPPKPKVEPVMTNPVINQELTTQNHIADITKMVEHPPHYTAGTVECIEAIMSACVGLTPQEAICQANVIKYVWRFKHKNKKQDLLKALWYLNRLIELQS